MVEAMAKCMSNRVPPSKPTDSDLQEAPTSANPRARSAQIDSGLWRQFSPQMASNMLWAYGKAGKGEERKTRKGLVSWSQVTREFEQAGLT